MKNISKSNSSSKNLALLNGESWVKKYP